MIRFTRVWGEGFGSIVKRTSFNLDREGLNILVAPNGSGKTSLFNMVFWVLYGQSLKFKTVTTWDEIKGKDFQGTIAGIEFTDGANRYEVIRCKDYTGKVEKHKGANRLLLYINGEHQTKVKDKTPTQETILQVLGYSADLFKNSIIFGQKLKRLVQESGPQKKKVFEEAFDAGFLKNARDKASKHYKELVKEFSDVTTKYTLLKGNLEQTKDNLLQLQEHKAYITKQRGKKINELNEKLEALQKEFALFKPAGKTLLQKDLLLKQQELAGLANSSKEVGDLEKAEFRETNRLLSLESKVGIKTNELNAIIHQKKHLSGRCPRCGQRLHKKDVRAEKERLSIEYNKIKAEKKQLQREVDEQEPIAKAILEKLDSKKDDKTKILQLNISIKGLEQRIISQQGFEDKQKKNEIEIDLIRKQITQVKKEKMIINLKPLQKSVKRLRSDKKKIKPIYIALKKQIKDLKWAIDDVLGNKGLKAYIFDTMLSQLNNRLTFYEQFIGYRVEFMVDMDSTNKDIFTVCYKGKYQHYYEELSGAQQQTCDIATAFALHDLMSEGKPVNILIFDEVFEGLDERNIDIVNDLIAAKAQTKCVYLITHKKELQVGYESLITLKLSSKGHTIIKELAT